MKETPTGRYDISAQPNMHRSENTKRRSSVPDAMRAAALSEREEMLVAEEAGPRKKRRRRRGKRKPAEAGAPAAPRDEGES